MKIEDRRELDRLKEANESFYIYFSAPSCGVCEVLKPKIDHMFDGKFPKLRAFHVNTSMQSDIAVFNVSSM
ncbi:thioredoxin family protein [Marinifilum sp.]|uniref:thioredoxin family protein n=1 Tax=Marinifilum sp. TaxID=2033137 RepID=UPI003BAAE139